MPLRKPGDTNDDGHDDVVATSKRFPPEAHAYDTDVTDKVVKRVKAEAEKVLEKDEWVVIDGVDKR
jgi:hypothetical protein